MRDPRRISVPAPLTVNSSRSSCSGLTTVTLSRWGTDSTTLLDLTEQHRLPARQRARRQQPLRVGRQADHRQNRPAVRHQARPPAQEDDLARLQRGGERREQIEARVGAGERLAVASSDTSGIAPRATMARIAASVSAADGRDAPSPARRRTGRRPRPATPTRASPARPRPWAPAGPAPPPAPGPGPPGCAGRSAADRARSSRSARWAPASRSSPCAARGAGAGTDRCRPWRRRFRESAGRYLLPSPEHVRKRGARRLELGDLDVLVGGVRLRDVARTEHDRVDPALGAARRLGPVAEIDRRRPCARPAAARSPRGRAAAATGWIVVTDQAIACGDVAARTRRSASASRSSTRSPGAGRSENVSVARVGTTLNAMPPSSAGDVQVDALEPGRPLGAVFDAHVVQRDRRARQHRDRVQHLVDARRMPARRLQRDGRGADAAVAHADPAAASARRRSPAPARAPRRCRGTRGCSCRRAPRRPRTTRRPAA